VRNVASIFDPSRHLGALVQESGDISVV